MESETRDGARLIDCLKRWPKAVTAAVTFLLTGSGFAVSPHLGDIIAATHTHRKQVTIAECPPPITPVLPVPASD